LELLAINSDRQHRIHVRNCDRPARVRITQSDLIEQSGRYAPNASTIDGFTREREERYGVHFAIDRFTGQVINKYIEVVNEECRVRQRTTDYSRDSVSSLGNLANCLPSL
jgi:hypothetical protein